MKNLKFFARFACLLTIFFACDDDDGENSVSDLEATYSVNSAKEINTYSAGESLATVSDGDGAIVSAKLNSGSSLPDGVALNGTSGELTVSDVSSLVAGTYSLSITTEDSSGGATTQTISLMFDAVIDVDAEYTVSDAKAVGEYTLNESIATVTDSNGDIASATLANGSELPDGVALDANTGEITITDPGMLIPGIYSIEVSTTDIFDGSTLHTLALVFNENSFEVNINSGGDELVFDTITYAEDAFFLGDSTPFTPDSIPEIDNTDDDELYVTERYGLNFGYAFEVDNATYKVTLHFVELYWGAPGLGSDGGAGDRVFDVLIEDVVEIDDYDIFAEVGALFAVEKEFDVMVTDGILNIDFLASIDNAKISAISIEKMN